MSFGHRQPDTNLVRAIKVEVKPVLVPGLPQGARVFKNELREEAVDVISNQLPDNANNVFASRPVVEHLFLAMNPKQF